MNREATVADMAGLCGATWCLQQHRLAALGRCLSATAPQYKADIVDRLIQQRAAQADKYDVEGGVAVLPVRGYIMKRVHWIFDLFGIEATSTEETQLRLAGALADPAVKAIMLSVESPGGTIDGVQALADDLYAARPGKPLVAAVEDLCCSAGYWIAAQAEWITANPTATVGSIGVYAVVDDFSRAYESMGIQSHVIASGLQKGVGDEYSERVTAHQLAPLKAEVQGLADMFVAAVARGRGKSARDISPLATGAYWLATDAKTKGLVDELADSTRTLATLAGRG